MTRSLDYDDDYENERHCNTFLGQLYFIEEWSGEKRKYKKSIHLMERAVKTLRNEYHRTYVWGSREQKETPNTKRGRKAIREIKKALKEYPFNQYLTVYVKIYGEDITLLKFFEEEIAKDARALFKIHDTHDDREDM